jgi:hypothetical protein
MECTEIHYNEFKLTNRKTKHTVVANFGIVGEYTSRERCLKIIDDIENRLAEDVDFVLYTMPEK